MTILGQNKKETDAKFCFWAYKPLRNSKKKFQAFESLNSDVQARS